MKEPYHSSPPMSACLLAEGLAPTKKKNIKNESLSPGVGWGRIFWSMLRHSALVFLRSSGIW